MIVGERILEVSGNKALKGNPKGLGINIALEDVKLNEENKDIIEITYVYTANYQENIGEIKIKGILLEREDGKTSKFDARNIAETWKKSKKVPDDYASIVLSQVNYSGSANGTLLARVLNLSAPLIPPRIQLNKGAEAGAAQAPKAKK
ncbi:MAG: hypothetical protein V1827_00955 [Candidatus Micrarchaeota archaeon]